MEHIGQRIKDLRKKADLTQDRLADYLGVSAQAVSKWELGQTAPDLSLIAPLCRVLGVTADELLGLNEPDEETEALIEELRAYRGKITREMEERFPDLERQAAAHPTDLRLSYEVAAAEYWLPSRKKDQEEESRILADIEKRCHAVLDRTTDPSLRENANHLLADALIMAGRREEAMPYAEACSGASREFMILRCLEGEAWIRKQQNFVYGALNKLLNMLNARTDHLPSLEMIEKIIRTVFPDGNYLGYYPRLIMGSLSQARLLVRKGDCDRAMEKLRDFAAYARGFEEAMGKSGYLSYTSPVLDHWGESAEGLGRLSGSVDFGNYVRQSLSHPDLNPLRERDDFKALRAELEEGTSCGSSTSRE